MRGDCASTDLDLGELGEIEEIPIDVPDRDYTVDGGFEFLYHWQHSELQVQVLTDISDKHNGQEIWLSWAAPRRYGRWQIAPSVGVNWKSSKAANYYYGVEDDEATLGMPAYDVGDAANVFGRLAISYAIDQHWKIVSVLQYEKLADDITDSPIVADDHVQTGFVGIYYEF